MEAAEIAFKSGIKEVVDTIGKHPLCETVGLFAKPIPLEDCGWWQDKLVEWGIE